ncbi:hypothetical protein L2755_04340 [Shewanella abyssi]|uniref:hypothetical protein n=1 Tax=Shewanella abyssi TaxID=311789 RepID=UPI00200FA1AD|nr:hypothetical protein [Shewanella abyssi]MCL1048858.1 hypothetical protein [Shewanella abyssi]
METNLKIIEALANGINPLTGEALPEESPYNSPEIIRALFSTLEFIKYPAKKQPKVKKTLEQKQAENLENGLPKNAGLPWTEEQKNNIAEQFKIGKLVSVLAVEFERTNGSINSELKKQGLIEE